MSNITEYKDIRFKDFVKIPHTHPNKTLIKYMTLPKQIKRKKRVVRVLSYFLSDIDCPYETGLTCYTLEDGYRVVLKNGKFMWLKCC